MAEEESLEIEERDLSGLDDDKEDVLIDSGFISQEHMPILLGVELGFKSVDLSSFIIEPEIASLIPKSTVRKLKVLPFLCYYRLHEV